MFAILAPPLLPDNAIVFTSRKQGGIKREHCLLVSMHCVQLMEFSLGLS